MNTAQDLNLVADDLVVTMEYELSVDGEVVDSSTEEGPIQFVQGHGNIIVGLEQAIRGMAVGERKQVKIPAAEGYGEFDPDQIVDIPIEDFPEEIPLEDGIELEMKDQDGDMLFARIIAVSQSHVRLDFNHPLSGKDLHFRVQIVSLRAATPEELAHGHAHSSDGHAHD